MNYFLVSVLAAVILYSSASFNFLLHAMPKVNDQATFAFKPIQTMTSIKVAIILQPF